MSRRDDLAPAFLDAFIAQKQLAERAIEQVSSLDLRRPLDDNTNSIAVIMKHVGGNLRSRFTDFLNSDGEKPWRDRDDEFVDTFRSRDEIMAAWESGWSILTDTLAALRSEHLFWTVYIRGEPHTVPEALTRSLAHTSYHVGQIVLIARVHNKANWNTLTIPRGGSKEHNRSIGFDPTPPEDQPDDSL